MSGGLPETPAAPGTPAGTFERRFSWDGIVDDTTLTSLAGFGNEPSLIVGLEPLPFAKISQTNETGVQQTLTFIVYCRGS